MAKDANCFQHFTDNLQNKTNFCLTKYSFRSYSTVETSPTVATSGTLEAHAKPDILHACLAVIIILINGIYMAQIRKKAAKAPV